MQDLVARQYQGLSSSPPSRHARNTGHPTLLVSWFCTGCALVIILLRVGGRYVRTERLFTEDTIMFFSIIPLLIRAGLIHVVLLYGTNNVQTDGLTPQDVMERETGAKLVLAARIFYAMFIWMGKWTISEFLKRLTATSWNRHYETVLRVIRGFLVATFLAVVIGTLAECQPFSHTWQVIPDPGPSCREDYAQVLIMSIADVLSDLALIAFPIPIILTSGFALKRKISLTLLFMTSAILIPITIIRVIIIIDAGGRQQRRSLWASIEILAAAAVSNVVVLGSFVRDRGVKKAKKYKADTNASVHSEKPSMNRRMTAQHWGNDSDTDLFRTIGGRLSSVVAEEDIENAMQDKPVTSIQNLDEILRKHSMLDEKDMQIEEGSVSAGTSSQGSNAALMNTALREQERAFARLSLPEARNENNAALAELFRQGPPGAAPTTGVQDFARRPSLYIDPMLGRRGSGVSLADAGGLLVNPNRRRSSVSFADLPGIRGETPPPMPTHPFLHRPSITSSAGTGVSPTTKRRQSRLPSIIDTEFLSRLLQTSGPGDSDISLVDAGGLLGPALSPPTSPASPRQVSNDLSTIGRALSPPPSASAQLEPLSPPELGRRSISGGGTPRAPAGWSRRFNFSPTPGSPAPGRTRRESSVRIVSGPGKGHGPEDMEMADAGGLLGAGE